MLQNPIIFDDNVFPFVSRIIQNLRKELKARSDEKTRLSAQKFFKEKLISYGVKTPIVSKIAQTYWREVKSLEKTDIFKLCEKLYRSGYVEEAFVVSSWMPNMLEKLEPTDLSVMKHWIEKYINNWASCDALCNHTVGGLVEKYPDLVDEIKNWAASKNRWLKRASAVSLILPARKGKFLQEIFQISDELLCDSDDLVQKGYGWLLKEASRIHQMEVFNYVSKNKTGMPRTALRYAIELMPDNLRKEAMKKAMKK